MCVCVCVCVCVCLCVYIYIYICVCVCVCVFVCVCVCVCVCVYTLIRTVRNVFFLVPNAWKLGWFSQAPTRLLSFFLFVTVRISYSTGREYCKLEAVSCTLGKRFTNTRKYFKKHNPFLRGREYSENRGAEHPVKTFVVRILDDSDRERRRNFVNLYLRGLHIAETHTHTQARVLRKLVNTSTLRRVCFSHYSTNCHCIF